jgi:hypothetical protein
MNEVAKNFPGLASEPDGDAAERLRRRILVVTTLAYIGCLAVWTIFVIIGVEIRRQYGLSDTEFGPPPKRPARPTTASAATAGLGRGSSRPWRRDFVMHNCARSVISMVAQWELDAEQLFGRLSHHGI